MGEERGIYDEVIRAVDHAFTILGGKIKALKSATVSRLEFKCFSSTTYINPSMLAYEAPPKEPKAKAKRGARPR